MFATITLDAFPWYWKQRNKTISSVLDELAEPSWQKAQTFPSEVHVELLKANLIPDPYLGFNEHKVQWIADVEWLYSTKFPTPSSPKAHTELVFHGLDAIVDVYLNGNLILSSNNQFQIHTVPVSLTGEEGDNTLFFHFKSAKLLAKELEGKFGRVRGGSTNLGDPSRVYVRKAQYDWRWDWGPELHTTGPYRTIELNTYDAQLSDLYARTSVNLATSQRSLDLDLTIKGTKSLAKKARVTLSRWGNSSIIREEVAPLSLTTEEVRDAVKWEFTTEEISLWWPVGYGDQALYELKVDMLDDTDNLLSTLTKRIGFRTVELIQRPLSEPDQYGQGSTFFFRVNNTPIFAVGSNWIPADNFLTTVSKDRYRDWMKLARDGGQNMVRVWGGGVYEDEALVDACDEFGLLLWHDFQFACGVYPGAQFPEFVESVKKEAEDNVKRLRNHPCMTLWCGNNEDYQMVLQWGDVPSLPATLFYEDILPSIVKSLTDPPIPYHPGSPYGGVGWDTADPTIGDVHQWNVWGGKEHPWQSYDVLGGRFVSEFGMPGLPSIKTIEYYFQGETEDSRKRNWHPQSKLVAQHTKAGVFERRFAIAMNDNFRITEDLEIYSYRTQLMQSCAIGYAYSTWRREWRGKGKEYCGGVLVWQLNDCWPGTSWALVDYFLRPKPVYYAIKRAGAPVALGIYRTVHKNRANDRPKQFYEYGAYQTVSATIDVWVSSSLPSPLQGEVELMLTFFDLGDPSWKHQERHTVQEVKPNQTTEVLKGFIVPGNHSGCNVIVLARLLAGGKEIARETDWPQPYRYLELPQDPGLTVVYGKNQLKVEVKRPVKGVFFEVEPDLKDSDTYSKVNWSDNGVDLVPGENRVLSVSVLPDTKAEIRARWLGHEKGVIVAVVGA
ncbi:hypothetical protein E1B28_012677 [Marasmius oreades]|uniref:Beta-mannosidase B n=1 Tax=Marasmius oreades TaxID=181124 RepID=A0A9P7RS87_9AGAR|nr:uncharacterized protein E1B28_012677 [Marasmius oreades]KAG7088707.1 hypothetical protein E1B28_012677 [Marasmius oreades]